jgi:antitoxin component YwqK of YwqJK toxin-antitoxin module
MEIKMFKRFNGLQFYNCILFLIFFNLFTVTARAQPGDYPNVYNTTATDTIFLKNQIIIQNATKDTLEIADFKRGKKNGEQILFFNNGKISRIAKYKNDLLDGEVIYFSHDKDYPIRIEHYKAFAKGQKALLHGPYKVFAPEGTLLEKTTYKNGQKNGKYELYHNNGQLKEEGTFEDGLNVGVRKSYNANGILIKDENFIIIENPKYVAKNKDTLNDKVDNKNSSNLPLKVSVLNGKVRYYHYNGFLASDLFFKNGKKEGLAKEYYQDKSNSLESAVVFKEGLEHGDFTYFNSRGYLERKGKFYREIQAGDTLLKNVYDGTIEIYHDKGKISRIENWKNFQRNGVQENYSHNTGNLSERYYEIDNLKTGTVERFKDGVRNYLAHFEIVEKKGQRISQQTGTETYWENGKERAIAEWKNGVKDGVAKTYYKNGQVESIIHFREGKLHGPYKTYYENGKLKEDYTKQYTEETDKSVDIGWNTAFDQAGQITKYFFATGTDKILTAQYFEKDKRTNLTASDIFKISFFDGQQLSSVNLQENGRPFFAYEFFSNKKLRQIHFTVDGQAPLSANFTSEGDLIQVNSNTSKIIDEDAINEMAKKIAAQYNPNWQNEILATQSYPNGKYQWNYADGAPFFKIEFKDSLPHGDWIAYNPISKDTLFYAEYHRGLPLGKYIRNKMDGSPELRVEYFQNQKVKESYYYGDNGIIRNIYKNDSTGTSTFYAEYYPDGKLKEKRMPTQNSYINLSPQGDTLSYRLLYTRLDSIRVNRLFYGNNKLRNDRYNNLDTGIGSAKTYFENGQLQTFHELKNDKPHGIYQKFDENGTLLTLGHFKDGKRDGKWINYEPNEKEEISFFENGEILIEKNKDDEDLCKCYDTSLSGSKIGFANSLKQLAEYQNIKPFIPQSIIPINELNYEKIFYINFGSNNDQSAGFTHFKLLLFQEFSFQYPSAGFLKFNLNPCKTEGYISNIEANVAYRFDKKQILHSEFRPRRIAVSLQRNPLVNAADGSDFTSYFDTEELNFDANGIKSIPFAENRNECYPLGIIKDFMTVQIEKAHLSINPQNNINSSNLPLLKNEKQKFYGLEINNATVHFEIGATKVKAVCDHMLAGANYVAARLFIEGRQKGAEGFIMENNNAYLEIQQLKNILEQKGFYRVKVVGEENKLMVEFYVEK